MPDRTPGHDELTGEVSLPRGERAARPSWAPRLVLYALPYLIVVAGLAAWLGFQGRWIAYVLAALPITTLGFWRGLERVREDLVDYTADAPPHAALLLGGLDSWRRDVGLCWIAEGGRELRFVGGKQDLRVRRGEIEAVRVRPWMREIEVAFVRAGARSVLRLGGLIDLTEPPRFARELRRWTGK